jgi:hypothetical protein
MKQRSAKPALVIAAAFLFSSCLAEAQSNELEYVNGAVWTRAHDIEVREGYAYCSFLNGLGVLDVTDKSSPRLVSKLFLGGGFGIEVSAGHAFIAAGQRGLQVVDVSNPASPMTAGALTTPGEAKDIVLTGDRVYIADGPAGMLIVDVSDPAAPSLLGALDTPGYAESIVVSGGVAFVADGSSGLVLIDVSDPSNPTMIGQYDTPGNAEDLALNDQFAYVVDGSSGLHVINVSTPAEPSLEASMEAVGYAHGISIRDNHAFVGNTIDADFQILDISDPAAPTQVTTLKYGFPNEGWDVTIDGNVAYIVDHFSGIFVVDITDTANPEVLGAYRTPQFMVGLHINDGRAFTLGQEGFGLTIVDVSNPSEPAFLSRFNARYSLRFPAGVTTWRNYAYVTERRRSAIVDFGNVAEPNSVSVVPVPETARAIQARSGYAYVTADNAGFFVMDVSDPAAVTVEGSVEMPGFSYGVALDGNHAYLANSEYGLKIINIADPSAPTLISSLKTPDNAYGVAVGGNHAYIADGESGLQIVDVSDPASPAIVGNLVLGGFVNSVALSGNVAYVTDEDFGLHKVDISDPTHPVLVASFDTPGEPTDVAVVGEYVIVNDAFSLIVLR